MDILSAIPRQGLRDDLPHGGKRPRQAKREFCYVTRWNVETTTGAENRVQSKRAPVGFLLCGCGRKCGGRKMIADAAKVGGCTGARRIRRNQVR